MRCEQLTLQQRSEVTDLAHLKLLYPAADNELSKNWKLVTHFLAKIHEHKKHFLTRVLTNKQLSQLSSGSEKLLQCTEILEHSIIGKGYTSPSFAQTFQKINEFLMARKSY